MVSQETISFISKILDSDLGVTAQEKTAILKACRTKPRRTMISAKQAMEQLEISRPTLRAYVKQGLLHQVNLTARKVRFDQEEVTRLADYGMNNGEVCNA